MRTNRRWGTDRAVRRGRRSAQAVLLAVGLLAGLLTAGGAAQAAVYPSPPPDFAHPGAPHEALYSPVGGNTDRPMLVIYIEFSDTKFPPSLDAAALARRFFGPFPSVTGYYADDSFGRLLLGPAPEDSSSNGGAANDGVVSVSVPEDEATFVSIPAGPRNKRALEAADPYVDFAIFDKNNDGRVSDAELVVNTFEADATPLSTLDRCCALTRGIEPVTLDGKLLQGGAAPVWGCGTGLDLCVAMNNGDTNLITSIHEVGHVAFHMRDLYGFGVGKLDISGPTIGAADETLWRTSVWQKMHIGWLTPTVVTSDGFYSVPYQADTGTSFILYDPDRGTDDYFMVENRAQTPGTYDRGAADTGLVIWRIDDSKYASGNDAVRPIELMRPDGATVGLPCCYSGSDTDAWDPSDPTTPQRDMTRPWRDGTPAKVAVRAVGNAGPVMRAYFDVRGPGVLVDVYGLDQGGSDTSSLPRLAAGEANALTFPVMNTGEAPDTFDFTIAGLPAGWTATTETMPLGPGEQSTATVLVTPAENAAADVVHTLSVVGTSTTDGSVSSSCPLRVRVDPRIAITDVVVAEGDAGITNATFTVSLSSPSDRQVQVGFATADGTANAPSDYAPQAGTLTFAPGDASEPITVAVNGDTVDEGDETFFVNLTGAQGATIADGTGVGTILDDDRDGSFSCRASAIRTGVGEPLVANPSGVPCRDDRNSALEASPPSILVKVTAKTLSAATDQTPNDIEAAAPAAGDKATASAAVQEVTIKVGLTTITATAVKADAKAQCTTTPTGLKPTLSGSSAISTLRINGVSVKVTGHSHITIAAVGTLHINHSATTANSITHRALWLDSSLGQVVVSEAIADFTGTSFHPLGTPCHQ